MKSVMTSEGRVTTPAMSRPTIEADDTTAVTSQLEIRWSET